MCSFVPLLFMLFFCNNCSKKWWFCGFHCLELSISFQSFCCSLLSLAWSLSLEQLINQPHRQHHQHLKVSQSLLGWQLQHTKEDWSVNSEVVTLTFFFLNVHFLCFKTFCNRQPWLRDLVLYFLRCLNEKKRNENKKEREREREGEREREREREIRKVIKYWANVLNTMTAWCWAVQTSNT